MFLLLLLLLFFLLIMLLQRKTIIIIIIIIIIIENARFIEIDCPVLRKVVTFNPGLSQILSTVLLFEN